MYGVECVIKMYNTNKLKKFRRFKLFFSTLVGTYANKVHTQPMKTISCASFA